jgi:hypothetical protein
LYVELTGNVSSMNDSIQTMKELPRQLLFLFTSSQNRGFCTDVLVISVKLTGSIVPICGIIINGMPNAENIKGYIVEVGYSSLQAVYLSFH